MNEEVSMKIGVVYTSTTEELVSDVNRLIHETFGEVEIFSQQDPSILREIQEKGFVTAKPAARLITMYLNAVNEDCDVIFNICSSVGEVADSVQDMARYLGVPIVRIDEEMCKEAVRKAKRIAVMATLPTTMVPTCNTIRRVARELGKEVEITECLVEGAFGLDQDEFRRRMAESAAHVANDVDAIVFAQGSMAYCETFIAEKFQKLVLSSPRFGVLALRSALLEKGLIQ
jgi:hypothetical protein